jgi:alkaline phosphatase
MKNMIIIYFAILFFCTESFAQNFSLQSCHAHNDYVHQTPFYEAYNLGFGSIEADVFLINDELFVAHDSVDISKERTLKKLYIDPILAEIEKNDGKLKQPLQLLIDLKTSGNSLKIVENQLIGYKELFKKAKVKVVISGEMPAPADFEKYDEMINFDGRITTEYTNKQLKRVGLYSQSFGDFVKEWKGKNQLGDDQLETVENFVKIIHKKGKKLRFWATPDTPTAWTTLINLKLDYVGTDNLKGLAKFLE